MRILLLGAGGMAGHVIYTFLDERNRYDLLGTVNTTSFRPGNVFLTIYDRERLDAIIADFKPDFVVNCIGVLIRGSKSRPDDAIYANAYFPHYLARLSHEKGFKLIHISTDCVFSGKMGNYREDSTKDATDIYGLSKNLGEIVDNRSLTIRTSIIGPEIKKNGEGLFDWFMRQEGVIYGYKSSIWSGVTTLELAKFIDWVLMEQKGLHGLIHLTNNVPISKFDLLSIIKDTFNKEIVISDGKDYSSNKSFISTNKEVSYVVSSYQQMISEQKAFILEHKEIYPNYVFQV